MATTRSGRIEGGSTRIVCAPRLDNSLPHVAPDASQRSITRTPLARNSRNRRIEASEDENRIPSSRLAKDRVVDGHADFVVEDGGDGPDAVDVAAAGQQDVLRAVRTVAEQVFRPGNTTTVAMAGSGVVSACRTHI